MFAFQVNRGKPDLVIGVYQYFDIGISTLLNLKKALAESKLQPTDILDYDSGYGRVSRFLPHCFPDAAITVSEVKEQAMKFQSEGIWI